jgi:hypothetical protein
MGALRRVCTNTWSGRGAAKSRKGGGDENLLLHNLAGYNFQPSPSEAARAFFSEEHKSPLGAANEKAIGLSQTVFRGMASEENGHTLRVSLVGSKVRPP